MKGLSVEFKGIIPAEQINVANRVEVLEKPDTSAKGGVLLQDGVVVIATVEQGEGEEAALRLVDGRLLKASTKGELNLSKGDIIEAVVDKSTGELLLRMLNVTGAAAKGVHSGNAPASQQAISNMMSALRRNPEMKASEALFLAENEIQITPEKAHAVSQMNRGVGLGELLGQLIDYLVDSGEISQTFPQQAAGIQDAQASQNTAIPRQITGEQTPTIQVDGQEAEQVMGGGQAASAASESSLHPVQLNDIAQAQSAGQTDSLGILFQQEGTAVQKASPAVSPENLSGDAAREASVADEEVNFTENNNSLNEVAQNLERNIGQSIKTQVNHNLQSTLPPEIALTGKLETPIDLMNAVSDSTEQSEMAVLTGNGEQAHQGQTAISEQGEQIGKLIGKLFVRPEEHTGEGIKKAVDDAPQTLKMLKSALEQSDMKSKEIGIRNVEQAMKQLEIADKPQRFDYIQIPLAQNGKGETAELYVFKRNKGNRGETEGGTTILVALDTKHIGRVETLLSESKGCITLEFRLEEQGLADEFRKSSQELSKNIEAAGYKLMGIRFTGLDKRTTLLNAQEAVGFDIKRADRGIDIRI
mgnify:CR=1 FL=1